MTTPNPTPTPLASTAMEAARELSNDYTDTLRGLGHSVTPHDYASKTEEYFTLLQKHFQPLLAKVEGERDAANARWQSTAKLADTELTALRADLAAKEAALKELQKQLNACADERIELIEGIVHAISLVGTHTDAFCDQDTPEMANGSPEWESLHHLRGHLEGSLIGDDGEYLACDKFPTTTKT